MTDSGATPRTRVLHLLGTAFPGGVETFVEGLIHDFDRTRLDIDVCVVGPDGPVAEAMRSAGATVFVLNARQGFDPAALLKFWRIVRRGRYDVLHANIGGRMLRHAARAAGCRIVVTHIHGIPDDMVPHFRRTGATPKVLRELCEQSEAVVACSRFVEAVLRRSGAAVSTLQTIPCGVSISANPSARTEVVDLRRALGIERDAPLIGFVGRLVPQKGLLYLLAARERVLADSPNAHFVVIGDGPLRSDIEKLAAKVSPGTIHFMGDRSDVDALMPQFDMLVTPSEWEAFGLVNVEAMAASRPVVAFEIDGIPEAVKDGETGILVPHRDCDALGDAILALIRDPARAKRMGAAGRRRVETAFDRRAVAAKLEHLYVALAEGRPVREFPKIKDRSPRLAAASTLRR